MDGAGARWSLKKKMKDVGTHTYQVVAKNEEGKEGSPHIGMIKVKEALANVVEVKNPYPGVIECELPINAGPQHFIAKAAIHQLDKGVRTGVAPTVADRLEIAGDPPAFVFDAFGNVRGGIRTPYVDVPIARLSGLGQPDVSIVCFLFGTTKLFDDETLATLYPDHDTYVKAVEDSTDAAVQAGFLMPEDSELIKAAAAASDIGNP